MSFKWQSARALCGEVRYGVCVTVAVIMMMMMVFAAVFAAAATATAVAVVYSLESSENNE